MSVERLLEQLEPFAQFEETAHDLSFEFELAIVDEDCFIDFLAMATELPELTGGFWTTGADDRLIAFNGGRLEEQYGEGNDMDLADFGLDERSEDLLEDFSYYNSSEDLETAAERLYDMADGFEEQITVRGNIEKQIITEEIRQSIRSPLREKFSIEFWYAEGHLNDWLSDQPLENVAKRFFEYDKHPLVVFWTGSYDIRIYGPRRQGEDLRDLTVHDAESVEETYCEKMRLVRQFSTWHDSLPYLHPDHVHSFQEHLESPVWCYLLIYAILASFSDTVEKTDENIKFRMAGEHGLVIDTPVEQLYADWGREGLESVYELYNDFSEHEGSSAFQLIWGRAIAENTSDGLLQLPQKIEEIRSARDELEIEAIRENFDDLGDVIEDTQTLLAELNSRLSSAATETSRQIQGLGFTLVGAIIANLFLVLRWSDVNLLPPFSIVVTVVIIVVYLPLIQSRINDLDTVITEANRDYELYETSIQRFSEALFPFDQLRKRKSQYIKLAHNQRDRAQERISIMFVFLVIIWGVLAYISFSLFPTPSYRVAPAILSIPVIAAITQTPKQSSDVERVSEATDEQASSEDERGRWQRLRVLCSHTDYGYFNRKLMCALLVIILVLLVLDVLGATVFPPSERIFVINNTPL